jgi:hypothetical protein
MPILVHTRGIMSTRSTRAGDFPNDGSVLMPQGGRGNESAPPFITVNHDAAVRGFVIFHVDQVCLVVLQAKPPRRPTVPCG